MTETYENKRNVDVQKHQLLNSFMKQHYENNRIFDIQRSIGGQSHQFYEGSEFTQCTEWLQACLDHIYTLCDLLRNQKRLRKEIVHAFVDFQKASTFISHDILLHKLFRWVEALCYITTEL